jgi:transmembrane sensor
MSAPRNAFSYPDDAAGRHERIEREASLWAGRCERELGQRERERLRVWLECDPRHVTAFRDFRRLARRMDGLRVDGSVVEPPLPQAISSGSPRWSRGLAWVAVGMAAAVALMIHAPLQFSNESAAEAVRHETLAAPARKLALPDGSSVHLNADSAAVVRYAKSERRVELARGEAHFDVRPDPSRPFVVVVDGVRVRAVGTAFLVRRAQDEVEVLVTSGVVALSYPDGERLLNAGERSLLRPGEDRSTYAASAPVDAVVAAEIGRRLAWTEGRLDFAPTPLRDVVAAMNRHGTHRFRIADPAVETLSVGGSFRIGEPETFALLLEASFGLRVERGPDETVLRGPAAAPAARPDSYPTHGYK